MLAKLAIPPKSKVKTITTSCAMNFGQFPFDVQKCPIKYWTYQQSEQDVDLGVRSINDGDGASVVEIRSDASLNSGFFFVLETVEHTEEYEEDTKVTYAEILSPRSLKIPNTLNAGNPYPLGARYDADHPSHRLPLHPRLPASGLDAHDRGLR